MDLFRLRSNLEHWARTAQSPELVIAVEVLAREVVTRGGGSTRYVVSSLSEQLIVALDRLAGVAP